MNDSTMNDNIEKVILIRIGEIILKGLNRTVFESKLISNMKKSIYGLGKIAVVKSQSRIYIEPEALDFDFDKAIEKLSKVFGVVSLSKVWKINTDYEVIKEHALRLANDLILRKGFKTFKVDTKRGNKSFPMESPEISREIGAYLLDQIPSLHVDVIKPDFTVYIEVRESTYIYSEIIPAHGGMPVGTNGKAMLLLSGGIDSPVAGWMIAKRGVEISAIHFYSYPYTSERAKEKVIELTKLIAEYCYEINLHIVPFTEIQLEINDKCPEDQSTIIMRRIMMRISENIAISVGAQALITGESIGQVASQTMHGLVVTDAAVSMPVFRPLIGMDKNEVIALARKINTFETSILPYEDCCTVFVAKHPKTKPTLEGVIKIEKDINFVDLVKTAIANTEVIKIKMKSFNDNNE